MRPAPGNTTHAALAAGESAQSGRIAPGLRADLTGFALDPLAAAPDELAQSLVALTTSSGTVAHRR